MDREMVSLRPKYAEYVTRWQRGHPPRSRSDDAIDDVEFDAAGGAAQARNAERPAKERSFPHGALRTHPVEYRVDAYLAPYVDELAWAGRSERRDAESQPEVLGADSGVLDHRCGLNRATCTQHGGIVQGVQGRAVGRYCVAHAVDLYQ